VGLSAAFLNVLTQSQTQKSYETSYHSPPRSPCPRRPQISLPNALLGAGGSRGRAARGHLPVYCPDVLRSAQRPSLHPGTARSPP
jgi:hypothetical protein